MPFTTQEFCLFQYDRLKELFTLNCFLSIYMYVVSTDIRIGETNDLAVSVGGGRLA